MLSVRSVRRRKPPTTMSPSQLLSEIRRVADQLSLLPLLPALPFFGNFVKLLTNCLCCLRYLLFRSISCISETCKLDDQQQATGQGHGGISDVRIGNPGVCGPTLSQPKTHAKAKDAKAAKEKRAGYRRGPSWTVLSNSLCACRLGVRLPVGVAVSIFASPGPPGILQKIPARRRNHKPMMTTTAGRNNP